MAPPSPVPPDCPDCDVRVDAHPCDLADCTLAVVPCTDADCVPGTQSMPAAPVPDPVPASPCEECVVECDDAECSIPPPDQCTDACVLVPCTDESHVSSDWMDTDIQNKACSECCPYNLGDYPWQFQHLFPPGIENYKVPHWTPSQPKGSYQAFDISPDVPSQSTPVPTPTQSFTNFESLHNFPCVSNAASTRGMHTSNYLTSLLDNSLASGSTSLNLNAHDDRFPSVAMTTSSPCFDTFVEFSTIGQPQRGSSTSLLAIPHACKWANCFATFSSNAELAQHVNSAHLQPTLASMPSGNAPSGSSFCASGSPPPGWQAACQWRECDRESHPQPEHVNTLTEGQGASNTMGALNLLTYHLFKRHLGLDLSVLGSALANSMNASVQPRSASHPSSPIHHSPHHQLQHQHQHPHHSIHHPPHPIQHHSHRLSSTAGMTVPPLIDPSAFSSLTSRSNQEFHSPPSAHTQFPAHLDQRESFSSPFSASPAVVPGPLTPTSLQDEEHRLSLPVLRSTSSSSSISLHSDPYRSHPPRASTSGSLSASTSPLSSLRASPAAEPSTATAPTSTSHKPGSPSASTIPAVSPVTHTSSPSHDHTCRWTTCTRAFPSCDALTTHLSEEHVGGGKRRYECLWGDCVRRGENGFASKQKLLRHLQTHTGHRPFQCKVCKEFFSESATLQQHMRRHTQEKPYVCDHPGCGKAFSIAGALTIHRRTHNGHKPFKCTYCEKTFSESSNLSKHLRTHTGVRPYICDEPGCGKAFARADQLSRHKNTHKKDAVVDRGELSAAEESKSVGLVPVGALS